MPIELKVPTIGESVSEIYIGQWYKGVGDRIAVDENLVELESEKATLDVPSPIAGVLTKILKQSGDTAEVGEVIAHLDAEADSEPAKQAPEKAADAPAAEKSAPAPTPVKTASAPAPKEEKPQAAATPPPAAPVAEKPAPPAPPKPQPAALPSAPPATGPSGDQPSRLEETVPLSPVRRRIASRLVEAQHNAALLTTFNEIDMTAVKELRSEFGETFQKRHGVRLGFMSFFVRAAIDALRQCPEINAIIDGDKIVYRRYYDIGVAIGSDRGLVVPVIRNAEELSFGQIEKTIDDLAKRAQIGALRVDELQGGTFTITNGGVYGSLLSTPIVNPPQSGVLGMHAIQNRPVAIDNQVVIRPMMYVALTYDHRIVDGREAVTFLRGIKESIESPARIMLEV